MASRSKNKFLEYSVGSRLVRAPVTITPIPSISKRKVEGSRDKKFWRVTTLLPRVNGLGSKKIPNKSEKRTVDTLDDDRVLGRAMNFVARF